MIRRASHIVFTALILASASGCTVNPATGKQDFTPLMGADREAAVGAEDRQSPPLGGLFHAPPLLSPSFHDAEPPPAAPCFSSCASLIASFAARAASCFCRISTACSCCSCLTSPCVGYLRCMKLQNPPRLHSFVSFCRQQASRKSVTGESSAQSGRPDAYKDGCQSADPKHVRCQKRDSPLYHLSFNASTALCASSSHSNRAYTFPIK